jgi:hypothetical protein
LGFEQGQKPVGPAVAGEALNLRKIQRQVVCQDPVPGLGLGLEIASCVFDISCRSLIPATSGST